MKKMFSTIVLSFLFVLAITTPVEAHIVKTYKQCERFARKYLDMSCARAVADGLIVVEDDE